MQLNSAIQSHMRSYPDDIKQEEKKVNNKEIYPQRSFTLNSLTGLQTILVNGEKYAVDSMGVKIKTSYPQFDTLLFPGSSSPVICNFKPDSTYSIAAACCNEFDIIQTWKLKNDNLSL